MSSNKSTLPDLESGPLSHSPKRAKVGRRLLIALALLPLILFLAIASLLGTESGRHVLLRRLEQEIANKTGWLVSVEDFRFQPRKGHLEIRNLVGGDDLAHPLFRIDSIRAHWTWSDLYDQGHWTLESVEISKPRVDLSAGIPESTSASAPTPESSEIPVTLNSWGIRDAEVEGRPLDDGWLAAWAVEELSVEGSFTHQIVNADIQNGAVLLEPRQALGPPKSNPSSPKGPEVTADPSITALITPDSSTRLSLAGQIQGGLKGPWNVQALSIHGDGLDMTGSANVGSGDDQPAQLNFKLALEPGNWASSLSGGSIVGSGDLDLRQLEGRLAFQLAEIKAETFEPFLPAETFDALAARGTTLHLNAELLLDGPDPSRARGNADLQWRTQPSSSSASDRPQADRSQADRSQADRSEPDGSEPDGPEMLASLSANIDDTGSILLDADLLPSAPGRRHFAGRIVADDLRRLDLATLKQATLSIQAKSLARVGSHLNQKWPAWVPAALPDGRLDLNIALSGPIQDLKAKGDGNFFPHSVYASSEAGASGLSWTFSARPTRSSLEADLRLQTLNVPDLLAFNAATPGCATDAPQEPLDPLLCDGRLSGGIKFSLSPSHTRIAGQLHAVAADGDSLIASLAEGESVEIGPIALQWTVDGPTVIGIELNDGPADLLNDPRWSVSLNGNAESLTLNSSSATTTAANTPLPKNWRVEDLRFTAGLQDRRFEITDASWSVDGPLTVEPAQLNAQASGRLLPGPEAERAVIDTLQIQAALESPAPDVDQLRLSAELEDGILSADLLEPGKESEAAAGTAKFVVPLANLEHLDPASLGFAVADLPLDHLGQGPLEVFIDLPNFDSNHWLAAFAAPASDTQVTGVLQGHLEIDPAQPTAASGRWQVDKLQIVTPDHQLRSIESLELVLADHLINITPSSCLLDEQKITLSAQAQLDPKWMLSSPLAGLLMSIDAQIDADIETSSLESLTDIFQPEGKVRLSLKVHGDQPQGRAARIGALGQPSWIVADVKIDGSDTTLTMNEPYATRFDKFQAEGTWQDDTFELTSLRGRLNEGELEVFGEIGFSAPENPCTGTSPENPCAKEGMPEIQMDLQGLFDSVRYRLDYGLTTLSSGNFSWRTKENSPDRLTANILVERGSARRRIDATRELLNQLLAPPSLDMGSSDVPNIELDIDIATIDGIRIKNNLANLHASWDLLSIEGPLSAPRTHGSIDLAPDGRIYAYGQVLRIDSASLRLSGNPSLPSQLDLQTTSSIEDPSIATPEDRRFLASSPGRSGFGSSGDDSRDARDPVSQQIASGLTTFYGNQLASNLGQSLGGTKIRYEPLWIFGETDPGARLVISQDLNAFVSLSVAVDVAQGRDQIYLLDLHDFRLLPSFSTTVFADEGSRFGVTFQQSLELGSALDGGSEQPEQMPVLRKLTVTGAAGISNRRLAAWAGIAKDDPMPPGSDFDLEVDLAEGLRQNGFPGARVQARLVPVASSNRRVDAIAEVVLGPEVDIEFLGDRLPRARRREIRALYQTDFSHDASIETMRQRTVESWWSLGHSEPEVNIEVKGRDQQADPVGTEQPRHQVTVTSNAGERNELKSVEFRGISPELAELLQPTVAGSLFRMRLALGQARPRSYLESSLVSLGLPDAAIESVIVEDHTLVVSVIPGAQRRLGEIKLAGFPAERQPLIQENLKIRTGDAAVSVAISQAALTAQWNLRSNGYPHATVRPVTRATQFGNDSRLDVELVADPGARTTFGTLTLSGNPRTRESWVRRMASIDPGAPFDGSKVAETRRRLLQTRIFDHVRVQRDIDSENRANLTFDLDEKPPYRLGYGIRWDQETGYGGLLDLLYLNVGGRGVGLGARALWLTEQQSLRIYGQIPRLLGTDWDLELYGEHFDTQETDGFLSEGTIFSGQLSVPLGRYTKGQLYGRYRASLNQDPQRIAFDQERIRSPQIGMQWIHDRRDHPTDPKRGYFLSLDLSHARDLEVKANRYNRLFAQANLFQAFKVLDQPWIWAQSFRFGAADTDGEIPRSARFFTGGQYSVRGYDNRSLGPQETLDDGSSRAMGGEAMWVMSQELRIPVFDQIGIALFFDAGQVWGRLDDVDDALAKAAGLGLRYESPVGLLRLDLAFPLDRRPQDDELELYFGFGHSF